MSDTIGRPIMIPSCYSRRQFCQSITLGLTRLDVQMAQLYANPQSNPKSAAAEPTRRDVVALLVIGTAASLLLMFSPQYCNMQSGDSLIFVFASLKKLTWYYWGQDRLLNLVPAVTSFIRDPEANLSA
jgi:hypothetical protein